MRDYSLQCVLLVNYGKMSEGLMMILLGTPMLKLVMGLNWLRGFKARKMTACH